MYELCFSDFQVTVYTDVFQMLTLDSHCEMLVIKKMMFCRILHICVPLRGEGKCEEAVEDLPVLRKNETSRELRLEIHMSLPV